MLKPLERVIDLYRRGLSEIHKAFRLCPFDDSLIEKSGPPMLVRYIDDMLKSRVNNFLHGECSITKIVTTATLDHRFRCKASPSITIYTDSRASLNALIANAAKSKVVAECKWVLKIIEELIRL